MGKVELCEECVCAPVCSIFRATGGLARCVMFRSSRTGKWVVRPSNPEQVYCSECAMILAGVARGFFYCPNCGAKMDKEEDE